MAKAALALSSNARPAVFQVPALDEHGQNVDTAIAGEHPLTLYLDKRELVTLMTLGAAPEYLVLGYLRNQQLVSDIGAIASIQVDWETHSAAVTSRSMARDAVSCWEQRDLEERRNNRVVTTGCGQGTMFGDLMSQLDSYALADGAQLNQSTLYLVLENVRRFESIYKQAGAVHGCALCSNPSGEPAEAQSAAGQILYFVEDVGRHNAVDAIAGWMWAHDVRGDDKIFYTTGRLTSEMVIKCAQMQIPILLSRSGLTQMGYELAQRLNMTMIGRCQGKHYLRFTGSQRWRV